MNQENFVNINVRPGTRDQLREVAREQKRKIYDVIGILIEREYKKILSKKSQ